MKHPMRGVAAATARQGPCMVGDDHQDDATSQPVEGRTKSLNADGVPTAQGGSRWYASTVKAVIHSIEDVRQG